MISSSRRNKSPQTRHLKHGRFLLGLELGVPEEGTGVFGVWRGPCPGHEVAVISLCPHVAREMKLLGSLRPSWGLHCPDVITPKGLTTPHWTQASACSLGVTDMSPTAAVPEAGQGSDSAHRRLQALPPRHGNRCVQGPHLSRAGRPVSTMEPGGSRAQGAWSIWQVHAHTPAHASVYTCVSVCT